MRSNDRILVLERIDPKNKDHGMVDPRVFSGDNELHAVMDTSLMWTLKYKHGMLPPSLKGKFSSFRDVKNHVEDYLKTKNIKITKVID